MCFAAAWGYFYLKWVHEDVCTSAMTWLSTVSGMPNNSRNPQGLRANVYQKYKGDSDVGVF